MTLSLVLGADIETISDKCVGAARFVRGLNQPTCRVKECSTIEFPRSTKFGPTGQDAVAGWLLSQLSRPERQPGCRLVHHSEKTIRR